MKLSGYQEAPSPKLTQVRLNQCIEACDGGMNAAVTPSLSEPGQMRLLWTRQRPSVDHLRPELPALLPAQCCSLQEVSAADEQPRTEELYSS